MLGYSEGTWQLLQQLSVAGLVLGSWYALLGVSMSVIYSTTRTFHIAHAAVYTAAAYVAVVISEMLGLPLILAVIVGIAAAVLLGIAIDGLGYRLLRSRHSSAMVTFLFSLGVSVAFTNLIQVGFGPDAWPLHGFTNHTYAIGHVRITRVDILKIVASWILIGGTLAFLSRSRYGRAVTAVRTNEEMAAAVGVNVETIYRIVFALGSALVACAAILFSLDAVASPNMGLDPVLLAFVVVFVGGVGNAFGAALGGLLLGCATDLSGIWLAGEYSSIVAFAVLFVMLIVRPRGLLARAVP